LSVSKSGHLLKKKSNDNEEWQSVKVDLHTSVIKPLHAKWHPEGKSINWHTDIKKGYLL
jgi:hypothetical protein